MIYLFLGVFLYSLTHPVGAIFLRENRDPLLFSVIYIALRTLLQIPLLLTKIRNYQFKRDHLYIFIASGTTGAFLHWSEFKSLTTSIPIGEITFITYCFPLWIFIFSLFRGSPLTFITGTRFFIAVLGLYLIIPNSTLQGGLVNEYIYPIISSFLLATWILVSKSSQNSKIPPIIFSFFYDFLSFLVLLIIALTYGNNSLNEIIIFSKTQVNLGLIAFCLVVGIIPNILNFTGIGSVTPLNAALIMMFEPVIASIIAVIMYKESPGISFISGGLLILMANVPEEIIKKKCKIYQ